MPKRIDVHHHIAPIGSDVPFAKVSPIVMKNLDKHPGFSEKDHEKINYKNCRDLFPNIGNVN